MHTFIAAVYGIWIDLAVCGQILVLSRFEHEKCMGTGPVLSGSNHC